jgi:N-hydroxyarylamine O-acetyltransferase
MDINKYLERIQYKGKVAPELKILHDLQYQHLLNIPFENLDIHYGTKTVLDLEILYKKLILKKRGGACSELNGLYIELLKSFGFKAKIISARVFNETTSDFGPEFDHMAIIVKLDNKEYLTDVGFGDFIVSPLKLILNETQNDEAGNFVIEETQNDYFLVSKLESQSKKPIYKFKKFEKSLKEFQPMADYHQTSPDSSFTQRKLITKLTGNGRITISGKHLKIKKGAEVVFQKHLENEVDYFDSLQEYFNFEPNGIEPGH